MPTYCQERSPRGTTRGWEEARGDPDLPEGCRPRGIQKTKGRQPESSGLTSDL